MSTVKLATYEPPVRRTIQGDGVMLGTPMVFVRAHGCDYSCSWCDTKDSWREGSAFEEVDCLDLATRIVTELRGFEWVAITGGNPMLQADQFRETMFHVNKIVKGVHPVGVRLLVETQASDYNAEVGGFIEYSGSREFLLSLSPKLHDWRDEPLHEMLWSVGRLHKSVGYVKASAQIKVVVTSKEDCERAIEKFQRIHREVSSCPITYILLPEYSLGRKNVETAIAAIGAAPVGTPPIRMIPQLHKLTMFVP